MGVQAINLVKSGSYKMCKNQRVQLDCRKTKCIYHKNGSCSNKSPAITLNETNLFVCWLFETK